MRLCDKCLRRYWRAKIDKNTGLQVKHKNGNLIYICLHCGAAQEEEQDTPTEQRLGANVLYFDIETSASIYRNYGPKVPSKYMRPDNLIAEWFILGWSASYVGQDKIFSAFVTPAEAKARDDSRIVRHIHDMMESAEIWAGHNVWKFDRRKLNTRFMKHGLSPVVGKKHLDTLKILRAEMDLESNTLDYACKWFGLKEKDKITNEDWIAAEQGHAPTIKRIKSYCDGDTRNGKALLEKVMPLFKKSPAWGALRAKGRTTGDYLKDLEDEIKELKQSMDMVK